MALKSSSKGVENLQGPGEGPGYDEGDKAESEGGWLLFSGLWSALARVPTGPCLGQSPI